MTTVDDFLDHHGVKGMKWGIRRQARAVETPAERKKRVKKRVDAVRRARSITAGAIFVATVLAAKGNATDNAQRRVISGAKGATTLTKAQMFKNEEIRRNGAFQLRKMLKDMGEDVL